MTWNEPDSMAELDQHTKKIIKWQNYKFLTYAPIRLEWDKKNWEIAHLDWANYTYRKSFHENLNIIKASPCQNKNFLLADVYGGTNFKTDTYQDFICIILVLMELPPTHTDINLKMMSHIQVILDLLEIILSKFLYLIREENIIIQHILQRMGQF